MISRWTNKSQETNLKLLQIVTDILIAFILYDNLSDKHNNT